MEEMTECEYCGDEYHSKALTTHKRSKHPEKCDWECPTCDDIFTSRKGMRYHHSVTHGESLRKTECEECGDEFLKSYDDIQYCSNECRSDSATVTIKCAVCGSEVEYKKWRIEGNGRKTCGDSKCVKQSTSKTLEGHSVSKTTRNKIAKANSKEGVSFRDLPYGDNWKTLRESVLQRDGYECVDCGLTRSRCKSQYNQDLHVHHIVTRRFVYHHPFMSIEKDANRQENLVTVCPSCHKNRENQQ